MCLMQNIDMCLLYKSLQIARLVSHLTKVSRRKIATILVIYLTAEGGYEYWNPYHPYTQAHFADITSTLYHIIAIFISSF